MSALQRIRKQTGMSFSDTVRHYAGMRMSRAATAEELGVCAPTFSKMLKRFGLFDEFPDRKDLARDCKPGWPKGKPRNNPNRLSDEEILAEVAKAENSTEFRRAGGVSMCTVQRRFGSWKRAKELSGRME